MPFWLDIALGAAALLALYLLLRRVLLRRREARWRELPRIALQRPVVMVHGILGFDQIGRWGLEQRYFRGIWRYLELLGASVTYPRVPIVGSVPERAAALAAHVHALPAGQVIIVAHSMGGLDARYAIRTLGLEKRIIALVTVGTPHRGTSIAELGTGPIPKLFRWLLARFGLHTPAIDALTREAADRFNCEIADAAEVAYYSVVAEASWKTLVFNPALWVSYFYIRRREGPNDGLVSASSQRWGTILDEIDADHWSQIGWTLRFDARRLYENILRELAKRGY